MIKIHDPRDMIRDRRKVIYPNIKIPGLKIKAEVIPQKLQLLAKFTIDKFQ